jgi:hypothetical protein
LDWLRQGSDGHRARTTDSGAIVINPRDENSREALVDFQPIADEVMEHSLLGEFEVIPHTTDRWDILGRDVAYDQIIVLVSG